MLKLDHNRCPRGVELFMRAFMWLNQRGIKQHPIFTVACILNYPYKNRGTLNYSNLYNNRCVKLK